MDKIYLKSYEAEYKVAIIVAADRMTTSAANAFLKTLEDPQANSILILLSTEPSRILETILSRCLRLNCSGQRPSANWMPPKGRMARGKFGALAAGEHRKGMLGRYRLLDAVAATARPVAPSVDEKLTTQFAAGEYNMRTSIQDLRDKWEGELTAAMKRNIAGAAPIS